MSKIIAFAGKGGTGKTTVAALTIRSLVLQCKTPILAVDADPNSCLGEVLGVRNANTIGNSREKLLNLKNEISAGMSKENVFTSMLNEIIVENKGWDLLVMGRPEGPGCYCFANNVLRKFLENLSKNYRYVVIDNEAGMEHLSRHNTGHADWLIIVVEPNASSIRAADRIKILTEELNLSIGRIGLVMNYGTRKNSDYENFEIKKEIEKIGIEIIAEIPYEEKLHLAEISGKSFFELENDLQAIKKIEKMIEIIS